MEKINVNKEVNDKIVNFVIYKFNYFEKIIHKIKRFFLKQIVRSKRNMLKDQYIERSPDEKEAISICRDLIRNKKSELLLCPKSWERYVINEKLEIDVIINEKQIDIVNHTYHYTITISGKTHSIVTNIFDGYVEKRRQELKRKIFSNIKFSLNTIYNKVKQDLVEVGSK